MTGGDNGYRIARLTLIEGIRALSHLPHSSFILVGAHAVYHHTSEMVGAMTPFTSDGDLAADPRRIKHPRLIYDALEAAGFSLRNLRIGGLYGYDKAEPDHKYAAQLDILVPAGFVNEWNLDGYDKYASLAAMDHEGLEICLFDHAPIKLAPIDSEDESQSVEVEVAGIFALLISKGYKIGERRAEGDEAFKLVLKDIADIYRLLVAFDPKETAANVRNLKDNSRMLEVARVGASHIRTLCGRGGAGTEMLARELGNVEQAVIIVESLEALSEQFADVVEEASATARES